MIVYGILVLVLNLLMVLFTPLSLPDFPPELANLLTESIAMITDALPIIWLFFDKSIVTIALSLVLSVVMFEKLYHFIMWILAKLPIGIKKN